MMFRLTLKFGLHRFLRTDQGRKSRTPCSISAKKKSLLFSIYNGVTHRDPISNVGIESVGSAGKPALPNRIFCKQLPKVYVLSAQKVFKTFCAPFLSRIFHFMILAMP